MNYLKPILGKITKNQVLIVKAEKLTSDEEIMKLLEAHIDKDDIVKVVGDHYRMEYTELIHELIPDALLDTFDFDTLEKAGIVPYEYNKMTKTYYFAIGNFMNTEIRNKISESCRKNGTNARFKFAFEYEIRDVFEAFKRRRNRASSTPISKESTARTEKEEQTADYSNIAKLDDSGAIDAPKFVSWLIDEALKLGASDLHIERLEDAIQVRYRIDGVMTNKKVFKLNEGAISSIYVRIKGISNMDISEKRKPQDGRIDNYQFGKRFYDLRVSTVTTILGEKVVMRVFNKSSKIASFSELGFNREDEEKVKNMLHSANGIILMAGATGSGKTTTLYTMIEEISSDEVNIYTIEDPVEKTVANVNQISIDPNAGIDYPSTLKALLRQDPDIIVVGEIRDTETAELSVRASLTGHLVLSTIHANGALDAISRLLDMGVEAYLLGASAQGFLSQRLVRKLCPHCKRPVVKPKPHEQAWVDKVAKENNLPPFPLDSSFEPVGCSHCVNGYKGREAIVEAIPVTENIRKLLSSGAPLNIIQEEALKEGFVPMEVNGLNKALNGRTSFDELVRKLS